MARKINFSCIPEAPPTLRKANGSASRGQCQIYLSIVEAPPIGRNQRLYLLYLLFSVSLGWGVEVLTKHKSEFFNPLICPLLTSKCVANIWGGSLPFAISLHQMKRYQSHKKLLYLQRKSFITRFVIMTYKERQKDVQETLFDRSQLGGIFKGKYHPSYDRFILKNYKDNFIEQVCYDDVIKYFDENGIGWWSGDAPTTHTLSSQIACINHLFPLRKNHNAVLALAQSIDPEFDSVEILENDKGKDGYISFEVVSAKDHLNEKRGQDILKRGALCTSIDAVIQAKKKGKNVLLTIEWKYVESYYNEDKSQNVGDKTSGDTRLRRYKDLIENSKQLKSVDNYRGSVYFFEPFYQLMRQTLWAEQMVKHKNDEILKADDYIHVHVVPKGNKELLHKKYPCSGGKDMLTTWKGQLKNPNKYVLISPAELFSMLPCDDWKELICTLKKRYWQ